MQTLSFFRFAASRRVLLKIDPPALAFASIAALAMLAAIQGANAAGVTGAALKPAFDAVNAIVGGYGKQLLVLVGFVAAGFSILASNAASAMLKFIGYTIFLGVGLGIAVVVSGAVI
jgi:hypothetical protein